MKPKIRRAIEAVRQGLLFQTVVQARTHLPETEVSDLTEASIEAQFGEAKGTQGTPHERAVKAVHERLLQAAAKPASGPDSKSTTEAGT